MFPPIVRIGAFTSEIRDQINSQFTTVTQAGGSQSFLSSEGNLTVQTSSAGVSPGATAADNVVAVFSLPAGLFSAAGKTVQIRAGGSFAANGDTKEIKIIFNPTTAVVGSTVGTGGTTVADSGAVTVSGGGWVIGAKVVKYGAAGSNTQLGVQTQGTFKTVSNLIAPSTPAATESGTILVAVTANATTTASDVVFNWLEVEFSN